MHKRFDVRRGPRHAPTVTDAVPAAFAGAGGAVMPGTCRRCGDGPRAPAATLITAPAHRR